MKSSIYFITDCHFCESYKMDENKINSFSNIIKNDANSFIYLAISGDIAFSGKAIEYEAFNSFFKQLNEKSGRNIRLITCPGNHDINFNNENYSLSALINDTKQENVDKSFKERISKMAAYQSFERMYVKSNIIDNYLSYLSFKYDEKEIVFYLLNNVLFSCFGKENKSEDTKNYAYISKSTISNIKRTNPNQIVFLLMHFPITYFNDEIGHIFKEKIAKNVDILLNGHLHVPEKEMIIDKSNVSIIQGDYFSKGTMTDDGSFVKIDLDKNKYVEFKWKIDSYIEQEDEVKIELNSSRWNALNISFNNDYFLQLTKCEILNKEFNLYDIFVFPYLCKEKYGNFNDNESTIKTFPSLLSKIRNNPFVFIYGDEGSGKTSLSKYLTLLFFNENYFPVLCNGEQLDNIKDFERCIRRQIREMYSEEAISKFKNEIPISNKILIIDNYSHYDSDILIKAKSLFNAIVVISKSDRNKLFNKPNSIDEIEVQEYTIQPMLKTKRKEFTYKLYNALKNLGTKPSLSKEKFFAFVEQQLNTLDINDICDPISLAYIEINAFNSLDSFDNTLFSNVNQARSLLLLNDIIKRKKYNCNTETINRILSQIAYSMYKACKQNFSMDDIDEAINSEIDNYGDPGINGYDISNLMIDALIAQELNDRTLTFFNRDIFSYYIALYINIQIGDGDNTSFVELLNKDIFVPLNFNILMCLTSIYKSMIIPKKIIDLISEEAESMPLLNSENFSVSGITKSKQEELKKLTEEDIIKINEQQDEFERKKHNDYIKNKDNLYYVDIVPPKVKEINTWLDKLKICCVLLKNFSSSIKRQYKEKLINLIVSLPNIVLYKFNDYLFKELDNLYALLKENSNNATASATLYKFNNFIISTKRAFILSTYDYGSRCFTDNATKELLKSIMIDQNNELQIIQNLMFESYLIDGRSFIQSCTSIINNPNYKDNSFIKTSAKLIGRRYIVENFEVCTKNHKSFVGLVFESTKEALQYKAIKTSKN